MTNAPSNLPNFLGQSCHFSPSSLGDSRSRATRPNLYASRMMILHLIFSCTFRESNRTELSSRSFTIRTAIYCTVWNAKICISMSRAHCLRDVWDTSECFSTGAKHACASPYPVGTCNMHIAGNVTPLVTAISARVFKIPKQQKPQYL